jgi:hypothetical protein
MEALRNTRIHRWGDSPKRNINSADSALDGVSEPPSSARLPRMPFKSQAQRRKFAELLVQGKISNKTFEEWNRETGGKKLPERVKRKRTTTKRKKR